MIDYMQLSTSKHFRPALAVVLLLYVMFFILMFTMTGNEPKLMESPLPAAEIPSDRETIETQAERTIIRDTEPPVAEPCLHHCAIRLIDGTPPAHSISPAIPPTFLRPLTVLSTLIAATQQTIDIVVSGNQFPPATAKGRPDELYTAAEYDILNRLWAAFVNQAIRVRIVHIDDAIAAKHPPFETLQCMNSFQDHASEIMRSTLWLVDGRHAYLGATHGIGVWVQDCEPLAGDWQSAAVAFGNETTVLGPHFDARHGRRIHWNGGSFVTDAFVALPQRQIVANNHNATTETENSDDLLAILSVIGRARQYVNVALRFEAGDEKYWAAVRSALEEAALRHHVVVRVLLSYWLNDNRAHDEFLRSLTMLSYLNPAVSIEMVSVFFLALLFSCVCRPF